MKKFIISLFAILALAIAMSACASHTVATPKAVATGTPAPAASPTPPRLQAPGWDGVTVHKLCLQVEQSYPQIKGTFSLPITEDVQLILSGLGLQVVPAGVAAGSVPCDATLAIAVNGEALGAMYCDRSFLSSGTCRGIAWYCYEGAKIEGRITLTVSGRAPLVVSFSEEYDTPNSVTFCTTEPRNAPFHIVLNRPLLEGLTEIWGLQVLVEALGARDILFRGPAEEVLVEIGQPAIPALIQALEHQNYIVSSNAAEALAKIGLPAVPALIQTLKDQDASVRSRAAQALGEIGPEAKEAVYALIDVFQDGEEIGRSQAAHEAIHALSRIGPGAKEAAPALIGALRDNFMRMSAAEALKEITGQDFGEDAARWQRWWEENK